MSIFNESALEQPIIVKLLSITGAPCRHAGGSRADGVSVTHLPFPAVSFYKDLSAINHPKMTLDRNGLAGLFLTDYCKALPNAFESKYYFHLKNVSEMEARNGFNSTSSTYRPKNRVPDSFEHKYSVIKSIGSLPSPHAENNNYRCKTMQ